MVFAVIAVFAIGIVTGSVVNETQPKFEKFTKEQIIEQKYLHEDKANEKQ